MKRMIVASALIAITLLCVVATMVSANEEKPISARIVMTQRRDVYQTIGLLGQIAYADEEIILATMAGSIKEVHVVPEERIAKGSLLVSVNGPYQDDVAAFCGKYAEDAPADVQNVMQRLVEQTVMRVETDCTVREVYVKAGTMIQVGTPIARVSGTSQEVQCMAVQSDAGRISPGMWAWIEKRGESIVHAKVQTVERLVGEASGAYLVTLAPEQHIALEEGETVSVSIYISGSHDVVALPCEAITERETVWWVNNRGRCTEIPAQIVLFDETHAWVNLPEGLRVAIGEFTEGQLVSGASV